MQDVEARQVHRGERKMKGMFTGECMCVCMRVCVCARRVRTVGTQWGETRAELDVQMFPHVSLTHQWICQSNAGLTQSFVFEPGALGLCRCQRR